MAQVWRFPLLPFPTGAGVAVTAAALTGSGLVKLPQIPASLLVEGARLSVRATLEASCTTTGSTATIELRGGAVNTAIATKLQIAAISSVSFATGAAAWPGIFTWDGTFRSLGTSTGTIHWQGTYKSGHVAAGGGLTAALVEFPFPGTAAARTMSTLVVAQNIELDIGITMSATTGTPSLTVTDLWAELSG